MESVTCEGKNVAVMRITRIEFVHHSGVCVSGHMVHQSGVTVMMMIHQVSMMIDMFMMMQQRTVMHVGVMQIMCMNVFIMMIVLMDDMMIDHRLDIVQEVVWLMVHHLGDMMHWLNMVNWLVVYNFGSGCGMVYVMVHIMMQIVVEV